MQFMANVLLLIFVICYFIFCITAGLPVKIAKKLMGGKTNE